MMGDVRAFLSARGNEPEDDIDDTGRKGRERTGLA
jgi:hypothetical protein